MGKIHSPLSKAVIEMDVGDTFLWTIPKHVNNMADQYRLVLYHAKKLVRKYEIRAAENYRRGPVRPVPPPQGRKIIVKRVA